MNAIDLPATTRATPSGPVAIGRTGLLMTLCFIVSQADKQVMGLLALPVQAQFGLSNAELGLLQGATFAIAYAVGGVPVARLLDGGNRVRIAATCIGLWSLATLLCGLAQTFLMLALLRAATAVAEAGLPPAAFSIFGQCGDRGRMTRMNGLFMLAPFVGGGLVLALGGWLLGLAARGAVTIPGWDAPWRTVFLAIGIIGLILTPLLALLGREPARQVVGNARPPLPPLLSIVSRIFVHDAFLRFYYLGITACLVLSYAIGAWYPAVIARRFALTPDMAGRYAGLIFLGAGVAGTLIAAAAAPHRKRTSNRSLVRDYMVATALLVPVSIGMAMAHDLAVSLILYSVYAVLTAAIVSTMVTPIQLSLRDGAFARGFAIFTLLTSAGAGSIGPLLVGMLADHATLSLGQALAISGGGATLVALGMLGLALRATHD